MTDIVDRTPDPDIPAKELFLLVVKTYIPTDKLERFRQSLPPELRGLDVIAFVDSPFFRSHLDEIRAMEGRPGMLPELAHAAVLAERRKAEKIASQSEEVAEPATAILEDAEAAA